MKFNIQIAYNISEYEFEDLCAELAERLEGFEILHFSKGSDKGIDGRGIGFSKDFSSWLTAGSKKVIQAKHTGTPEKSCSEKTFYGNKSSIINAEIVSIVKLVKEDDLKWYILFTNRKLTGNADSDIRNTISSSTNLDIDKIELFGIEMINHLLSKEKNRDLIKKYNLNKVITSFEFSDEEIKEVILAFKSQLDKSKKKIEVLAGL